MQHRERPPSLGQLSWDDLRFFLICAESGSFRKAGKLLKVDSATIVRKITRLEAAIGLRLFNRLTDGVTLTDEGCSVVDHARAMERAAMSIERQSKLSSAGRARACARRHYRGPRDLLGPAAPARLPESEPPADLRIAGHDGAYRHRPPGGGHVRAVPASRTTRPHQRPPGTSACLSLRFSWLPGTLWPAHFSGRGETASLHPAGDAPSGAGRL